MKIKVESALAVLAIAGATAMFEGSNDAEIAQTVVDSKARMALLYDESNTQAVREAAGVAGAAAVQIRLDTARALVEEEYGTIKADTKRILISSGDLDARTANDFNACVDQIRFALLRAIDKSKDGRDLAGRNRVNTAYEICFPKRPDKNIVETASLAK